MNNYAVRIMMNATVGRKKNRFYFPGDFTCFNRTVNQNAILYTEIKNVVGSKNLILDQIYKFEETEEELILKKGKLFATVKENDMLDFEEDWKYSLRFNKANKEGLDVSEFENTKINLKDSKGSYCYIDCTSMMEYYRFINKCVEFNDNVRGFFQRENERIFGTSIPYRFVSNTMDENILYAVVYSLTEIEKFVNANQEKILIKNFSTEGFRLKKDTKKMSQAVGLPPFALSIVKKLRIENSIDVLSNICAKTDGNSLKILLEFFDNMSNFLTIKKCGNSRDREIKINNFLEQLLITLEKGYKMQDTINYVLRQRMYWSLSKEFGFPFEEMKLFIDYLNLNEKNDLKPVKYPQNLQRMHDVLVLNISDFDKSKEDDFVNAVSKYKKYENEFEDDGYCFITPDGIKSLIQEGNDLHHCIGTYVNKIISGESLIFFMRDIKNKKQSYVTVELDKDCNLIEIKGMFNQEPEDKVIKIAKKWAGVCKRVS